MQLRANNGNLRLACEGRCWAIAIRDSFAERLHDLDVRGAPVLAVGEAEPRR